MRKLLLLALVLCLVPMLAAAQTLSTTLVGGANEIPGPGDADGSGVAVVNINGTSVTFTILVNNIAAPTLAHIHRGAAGVAGNVVVNFNPTFVNGTATGTVNGVDQALINEILGNPAGFYVNVHTGDFPNGAIRGQLSAALAGGARTLFIPVVGKVGGAGGTNFVTDLRIINQTGATANATLDYFQGSATPAATKTTTVAPGEQKVLDDVIGFLGASGLGGLRITSDQNVSVRARVINDLRASNQGTTGFAVGASQQGATSGTLGFLSNASTTDINSGVGFRTNIGMFNPSSNAVNATFVAHRTSDGVVLGTNTVTVPGFGFSQQGAFSLLSNVGAADQVQPNFYITWTSSAPLLVYASVVDNKNGDSVLVQE
jgi:hypothetical protein